METLNFNTGKRFQNFHSGGATRTPQLLGSRDLLRHVLLSVLEQPSPVTVLFTAQAWPQHKARVTLALHRSTTTCLDTAKQNTNNENTNNNGVLGPTTQKRKQSG